MNDKITLGIAGLALLFGIYNTVQISNLDTKIDEKVFIQPATTPAKVNLSAGNATAPNPMPQSNAQQQPNMPKTSIRFDKELHDFGEVDANTDNPYSFTFTNTGKEPLLITNAKGSCGCTVPSWPKDPIMPGQKGQIDVVFRPSKGQAGKPQEKTVTVTANTEPVNTVVRIKAKVKPLAE